MPRKDLHTAADCREGLYLRALAVGVVEHIVMHDVGVAGESGVGAGAGDMQVVLQIIVVQFAAPVWVEVLAR